MPVDTLHPDYVKAAPKWKRIRDVLEGEDAVKEAGETYLPRLNTKEAGSYDAYKTRAQFFNATGRHHLSLQGFVFRKDPTVTVPDAMAAFMADCTMQGLTFYDYTKFAVREVLSVGRAGSLVDWDDTEGRPYVAGYCAEAIRNWRMERVRGRVLLTLLVLFEQSPEWYDLNAAATTADGEKPADAPPAANAATAPDEFEQTTFDQWRVYRLQFDEEGTPFVRCQVYRKREIEKREAEWVVIEDKTPTRRGIPLDRIPFIFHGPNNGLPDIDKIPLEDMALVNLSLYRTSADLEHGRHFSGLPTPWAAGFPTDKGTLELGSTVAWVSDQPTASCGFLEFTGAGLSTLEKAVEQKKGEMAALGARMLEPEAKKAEAFDTVAVRAAAETSALMNATVACTQTLSAVLQVVAWWLGTAATPAELVDAAKTELNTEFTVTALPPDQVNALVAAYLGCAMDWESFFWKMQQGEMFPPDADAEEVRANIQNNPPGLPQPEPEPAPGE